MDKKIKVISFSILFFFLSIFLFGCKQDTIKFYRESATSSLINKIKNNDSDSDAKKIKSGIIILHDNNSNRSENINFGPRDINFDMPVQFK